MRGVLQQNEVSVRWRARLEDHLGLFKLNCRRDTPRASERSGPSCFRLVHSRFSLPEREPHPDIFATLGIVVGSTRCGVGCGIRRMGTVLCPNLALALIVDLRLGRDHGSYLRVAEKRSGGLRVAGEDYKDKLLPLPQFLVGKEIVEPRDIADGLRLTGYFLDRHVLAPTPSCCRTRGRGLPVIEYA